MDQTIPILAVDDEPDVQALYEFHFRREIKAEKYQFFFAKDGQKALDILTAHSNITVVLADINMPGTDGLTLLELINQESSLGQRFQFVKVIMVTAYGDMPNIRKSLNFGAFDFLTKPIDFKDVEITISKALRESEKLQKLSQQKQQEEQKRIAAEQKLTDISGILNRQLQHIGGIV